MADNKFDAKNKQEEIANLFRGFHKLHFFSICPMANQNDAIILKHIRRVSERHGGAAKVSAIVRDSRIPAPAVSRTLNSLEKKGYITREMDPSDRRNTLVRFTDLGRETEKQIANEIDKFFKAVFEKFDDKEYQNLVSGLNSLLNTMQEELEKLESERGKK